MTDQDRINAITNAIQADSQLIILLRALIILDVDSVQTDRLIVVQNILGLPTS